MKLLQGRERRTFQRLHRISVPGRQRISKKAPHHKESDPTRTETVGRAISKLALRHDESDPTRAKCPEDREGCGSMRE